MRDRFKSKLYTIQIRVYKNHHLYYSESDDGTLYSGYNRTKILAQDLPEWYLFGRYYKCWGYMSTKGITDLLYVPNKHVNHFLKDDCLYISFGGKISETVLPVDGSCCEKYMGYDEAVWGAEIIDILKGAQLYSGYDISEIIQQIKEKKEWLIKKYPDEFGPQRWSCDVDKWFAAPLKNGHPPKFYALTLENYCVTGRNRYYGTLDMIQEFIATLDYESHKPAIDAFHEFIKGNTATYDDHPLLQPVTVIKSGFLFLANEEWEYTDLQNCIYKMRVKGATTRAHILKDGEKYVRCICPRIEELSYQIKLAADNHWSPVCDLCGQHGIMIFDSQNKDVLHSLLYLQEQQYDDVKKAVKALDDEKMCLDSVCEGIFVDG